MSDIVKKLLNISLLGFFLFSCSSISAQPSNIQLPIAVQQELVDAKKKALEVEKQLIEAKTTYQKEQHQLFIENEANLKKHQDRMFIFTVGGTIAGIILGWLSLLGMARGWIRGKVEEEINGNIQHLANIVDNSRLETRLKQETRILVLHDAASNNLDLIMRNFGFVQAEPMQYPDDLSAIKYEDYDLFIFDNLSDEKVKDFLINKPNQWCLAFREKHYDRSLIKNYNFVTANSNITIYPRLMELLIWKRLQK